MSKEVESLFLQPQGNLDRISGLLPPFKISNNQIPQGNFNKSVVIVDSNDKEYIVRQEDVEGRARELPFIEAEYRGVGFLDHPQNGFRLRTPSQQHQFTVCLAENSIKATRVIYSQDDLQIIHYEQETMSIADLWHNANPRAPIATGMALIQLAQSHNKGFILGDRWGPNEILTVDGEIMFVDFDIEIFGPEIKEFEIASMLYFNSYFAQQLSSVKDLNGLATIYKEFIASYLFTNIYDKPLFFNYLIRYFSYFANEGQYRWHDPNQASQFLRNVT